jgi:hypothetical protein
MFSTSSNLKSSSTLGRVDVVSWSKDSIYLRWLFSSGPEVTSGGDGGGGGGGGYVIRYQAVGSSVIQLSQMLDESATEYGITQLHENTNYDICVLRMRSRMHNAQPTMSAATSPAQLMTDATACTKATTSTDSLSVALGSTFGAFLALGLIVALVFAAKWQHLRRAKKRFADAIDAESAMAAGGGGFGGCQQDGIEDVLRVEMTVVDGGGGSYCGGVSAGAADVDDCNSPSSRLLQDAAFVAAEGHRVPPPPPPLDNSLQPSPSSLPLDDTPNPDGTQTVPDVLSVDGSVHQRQQRYVDHCCSNGKIPPSRQSSSSSTSSSSSLSSSTSSAVSPSSGLRAASVDDELHRAIPIWEDASLRSTAGRQGQPADDAQEIAADAPAADDGTEECTGAGGGGGGG